MVALRYLRMLAAVFVACDFAAGDDPVGPAVMAELLAGAHAIDIAPPAYPVIVNGGFQPASATQLQDSLHARCLVLKQGELEIALCVVDSCGIQRNYVDKAKQLIRATTGIPHDRIMISATHTHSAPSLWKAHAADADIAYTRYLLPLIAKGVQQAKAKLEPAQVGWTSFDDWDHTFCRRWIYRPDRIGKDPFGEPTVRANMHPGHENADTIGPSGPVDPSISMLAVRSTQGRPIALLANYSMHYYGATAVSSDYFGAFAAEIERLVAGEIPNRENVRPFVGMMSQGTSGDLMHMDYGQPARRPGYVAYGKEIAARVFEAYKAIQFQAAVPLGMREEHVVLSTRAPDQERLEWADRVIREFDGFSGAKPQNISQIYALNQLWLDQNRWRDIPLQTIRIGDFCIATMPCEVFGITGLKLKQQSPFAVQMNIAQANGADGYIPPPEQHELGGYTSWPTPSAMLEEEAEPKIVAALTSMLEELSGKQAKEMSETDGDYPSAVHAAEPLAYYRMHDLVAWRCRDGTDHGLHGEYLPGTALYLDGPPSEKFSGTQRNHCVHFAGGGLVVQPTSLGADYALELWFWNGLIARETSGILFTRPGARDRFDQVALTGEFDEVPGRLVYRHTQGQADQHFGRTPTRTKQWNHFVFVRNGDRVQVFLNGDLDLQTRVDPAEIATEQQLLVGIADVTDPGMSFEGKIDEVAIYNRALSAAEISGHFEVVHPSVEPQPTPPDEALSTVHMRPGFAVELVAAEPLLKDPVAIDWDIQGRLWVVEMADYPLGMDGQGRPGGRVRILEDTDDDGKYDSSTLFMDGLSFPNGIITWRDGVLITAAPDIIYAEDSDGDGKADITKKLFTGFNQGNQQLRMNGLRWGLDNWIYCASGSHHAGYGADTGVRAVATGEQVQIGSRDFRVRPDENRIDPQSGPSQFGRNRDDWGNWFGVQNSYPLWHYVLADHYIRRNSFYAPPNPRHNLTESNPFVYPIKKPQKRFHSFEHSNRFTSACSGNIYRDRLLFNDASEESRWLTHSFTCEPFHSLVQHNLLKDSGVSFELSRDPAEQDMDFLASTDRWFRPVMVRTGPDGALWVVDMYRYMIEHPEWVNDQAKDELRPYYRHGEDHGRIYRVVPAGSPARPIPKLAGLSTEELVARLEDSNGWVRDKVQQLLQWRADDSCIGPLKRLATQSESPLARLHAICTLDGLGVLDEATVLPRLRDSHAGVRQNAIRLAEQLPPTEPLMAALAELTGDDNVKVRLQLACSLGELDKGEFTSSPLASGETGQGDEEEIIPSSTPVSQSPPASERGAGVLLAKLLGDDPYLIAAVMSSISPANVSDTFKALVSLPELHREATESLLRIAKQSGVELSSDGIFRSMITDDRRSFAWRFDALAALINVIGLDETMSRTSAEVNSILAEANEVALDERQPEGMRCRAIQLLARESQLSSESLETIGQLLSPRNSPTIHASVVSRITQRTDMAAADALLGSWKTASPGLRTQLANALLSREAWTTALLDAIDSKVVATTDIDAPIRQRLLTQKNKELVQRSRQLWSISSVTDLNEVIEKFRSAAELTGDVDAGRKLFESKCSSCHRLGGVGKETGPNLAALTDKSSDALLASILDPSRAVEAKYLNYIVLTNDGRVQSGMITSETATGITLTTAEAKEISILRSDIEELTSTGKSLMPDGLEKDLTLQDVADLLQFIQRQE